MTMADDGDPMVTPSATPADEPAADAAPEGLGDAGPAAPEPPAGEGAAAGAEEGAPAPQPESLVDAIADLLQMLVDWLRAEAADIMRDKVVLPLQQLGLTLASASAAGCLVVIGLSFLFVALLLVLAAWLGWPGALTLVGVVILIGAGIFTYVKMRSIQK